MATKIDDRRASFEKNIKIFISCAVEDVAEAQSYRAEFQRAGFTVHLYDDNLYSDSIQNTVKSQIAECDFFILMVSKRSASLDRPWVARELGHALKTRLDNSGYRPIVIPVYCRDLSGAHVERITKFPVRDFETSELAAEPFDLESVRAHDPHRNPETDTLPQLLRSMQVEIALVHEDIGTAEELLATGAIDLYHQLFPEEQRAPLEDDLRWIFSADVDKPFKLSIPTSKRVPAWFLKTFGVKGIYRLKSYFFVLLRRKMAIGFAWVTYHRESRLLYGNYIGVHEQWRKGSLANPLIDLVQRRALEEFPECKGLVLEVEPFSLDEVEEAIELIEDAGASDEARLKAIDLVRRFKRVWWYETSDRLQAKCVRDARTKVPLVHTYPCMETDAPRDEWSKHEVDYWLLISVPEKFRRTDAAENAWTLWKRATDFSIIENMGKRTIRDKPEIAEAYWKYILGLQMRNVRRAKEASGAKVEFAPVFGSARRKGGRARAIYSRIERLSFKINV